MKKFILGALAALSALALAQTQYPLSVKHDLGTSTIAKIPERVIVYSEEVAEIAHVLGIKPVGYVSRRPTGQLWATQSTN